MPGNTSVEKTKCDSTNSNSVSKLFYGLLNKKCQQQQPVNSNPQLRRSFKLLKVHRSESNLPFGKQHASVQLTADQLSSSKLPKPVSTGSLCDLKMKSTESALLTSAQIATVISDNEPDEDEELPPIPPPRNSSLSLRPNHHVSNNHHPTAPMNPNYNRELPSLPIVEEKRKSISFSSRLSPISDDGGFNSFDYSSPNKRNSISVLNNRNFSNGQPYRNNLFNQTGNFPPPNRYGALINNPNNIPAFGNFPENNGLFDNRRNSYFCEVDPNLDLDYQNINSNNYGLSSQKSDNWSSSTSMLSYSGITSSSTSDYYTASSETITNSPSLSSLNSAGLCASSTNTNMCSSPPLNSCGKAIVNNHVGNPHLNSNKGIPYMRQPFSYPGSQLPSTPTKLAKCPAMPTNTGIAVSALVEKPKRQESASVLYYIVAKDASSPNSNHNNHNSELNDVNAPRESNCEQQAADGKLTSPFSESLQLGKQFASNPTTNYINHNNKEQPQPNQADLKAIQRSLHEFYLRHKGNLKDQQADHQSNNLSKKSSLNSNSNLINYSLTSNDSACSDSSTVSPANSPTLFSKLPTIVLPAKPDFLNAPKQLTAEEEERLNELKSKAIYSNIHFDAFNSFEPKENGNDFQNSNKELRLSFRERCSPFENKSPRQTYPEGNKTRNELKNLTHQPNSVKSIAKQFDSLSSLNCDLNANRVSPVSPSAGKMVNSNSALSNSEANVLQSAKQLSFALEADTSGATEGGEQKNENAQLNEPNRGSGGGSAGDVNAGLDCSELTEEDCRLKLKENEEKLKLFLEFLRKNELSKAELSKLTLHIEEVDKVSKLIISLSSRLNKIEGILQLRCQQQNSSEQDAEQSTDGQLVTPNKYKQSTSTDSLLDEKNLFSSILSLSSISLNNLNCNGSAFFASIEMLNSKKNKILDQLEEATQLKQMIEKRCKNLNERIICKYYDFASIDFETSDNREFGRLKNFDFVATMQHKHELFIKSRELSARLMDR